MSEAGARPHTPEVLPTDAPGARADVTTDTVTMEKIVA
jgi:hypothetical protein